MSKKMKITVTAAVMVVIMLVMSVAVWASDWWHTETEYDSGSIIIKGSLQTLKFASGTSFRKIYATLRSDLSGTGGTGIECFDMKMVIIPYDNGLQHYPIITEQQDVNVGDYINTGMQVYPESYGIDEVKGSYYYKETDHSEYLELPYIHVCVHGQLE